MDGSIARLSLNFAFKKLDFDITSNPGWLDVVADAFLLLASSDHGFSLLFVQVITMLQLLRKTLKIRFFIDAVSQRIITDTVYIHIVNNSEGYYKPRGTWKDADQGGQHSFQFITPIASVA